MSKKIIFNLRGLKQAQLPIFNKCSNNKMYPLNHADK